MICIEVIESTIKRGTRTGSFQRLRKYQWTNEKLKPSIQKANTYLQNKCSVRGPVIYYDFKIVEKKGRTCMMPEGEYYYYQDIEYKSQCFWGDDMTRFIQDHNLVRVN
jgi:hypothetical protein